MNILVTGGQGFLGRHVVRLLESQSHAVCSLDNLDPICGGAGKPTVNVDIRNYDTLRRVIQALDVDAIIHLAAYGRNLSCRDFPQTAWEVNVNGTLNILEIARTNPNIKRVVCCSSNIVLSDQETMYKLSKQTCEQMVAYYASLGVSTMALRPSNIGGAGQSRTEYQPCSMMGLNLTYKEDGHFNVTGDGTQARDFVNVKDVARAFALALNSGLTGETLDVCTGKLTSLNEIASILGVPVKYVDPRPGDAKVLISNPNPARLKLGFSSEIGIEETIRDSFPDVQHGE